MSIFDVKINPATLDYYLVRNHNVNPGFRAALAATYASKTRVVVGPSGDYPDLATALAAYPTGNVDIYVAAATLDVPATLAVSGVKNVSITGRSAFGGSKLNCTSGFITAVSSSDAWSISNLQIAHVAGANTHDAINVDYPRRWSVKGCHFSGFGGASVRLRGGIHCEVLFNYFLAEDSTYTNGLAAIYVEKSSANVVATTVRTQGNYVGAGVQYGLYVDSSKQSVFDNDIIEGCATGFHFKSVSGELRQPYTEANTVGISVVDSPGLLVTGDLRDQPVVTWSGVAAADRFITQMGARFINPGKALLFGGSAAGTNPDSVPSIRAGVGSPEGVVTGVVGSVWLRSDGAAGSTFYRKESGTGNNGWVPSAPAPTGVPTAAAGTGAGATPPAPAVVAGSTDGAGQISFGSGTTPAVGSMVDVTFQNPYAMAPTVVATAANSGTPSRQVYITNVTTAGFSVGFGAAASASQTVGTYRVNYRVN